MGTDSRKKVLIMLAPGFEEIETITVVDILRRSGAEAVLAGTVSGSIKGSRGVSVIPDALLEEISEDDFHMVVLPGGQPGAANLQNSARVIAIIKKMDELNKTIGAICAAPIVLQTAGILDQKRVTSHPSVKDKLMNVKYSEDRVVMDKNIITSRSPGTAMEFSMKLVEVLFGKNRAQTVNDGVLAKI